MLEFRVIPHSEQRYPTVGDYWLDDDGTWRFRVSAMSDWRYELLVFVHEVVEWVWCLHNGVLMADIDAFDKAYEAARQPGDVSEPGDDPRAPYRAGHQWATVIERSMALLIDVNWQRYEDAVNAL